MRCTASSLNCEVRGGSARFEIQVKSDGTPSCETHVAQNPKQTAGVSVCALDIHTRFRGGYVQRGCAMHRVLKTGRTLEFENCEASPMAGQSDVFVIQGGGPEVHY